MTVREGAREVVRRYHRNSIAKRNILALPEFSPRSTERKVLFLVPDSDGPSGGIRVIYRHVDLLNSAGVPAAVLHQRQGFRCTWFDHETTVLSVRDAQIGPEDLLVVGELNVGSFPPGPQPYRHLVFNQNPFLTWDGHPDRTRRYYRLGPRPTAILTVSEYARSFLAMAFSDIPIIRVRLGLDPAFGLPAGGDEAWRPRTITYMPRKGAGQQASIVKEIIEGSGTADGWDFQPLNGLRHSEIAARLRASRIFLSFGDREGFGLPAAEAMACGNYIIGSHGFGGQEFFDPDFCAPVAVGDALGMAQAVRTALTREASSPGWLLERGRRASAFVTETYSQAVEARDVVGTFTQVLDSVAGAGSER